MNHEKPYESIGLVLGNTTDKIRELAEAILLDRGGIGSDDLETTSPESIRRLKQENCLQQIELEIMQERLKQLQSELDATRSTLSAQQLVQAVDIVGGIRWQSDIDLLQLEYVSEQAERILGYPISDWISEPKFWEKHIHPDDRETVVKESLSKAISGIPQRLLYRMLAADGRTVWFDDLIGVIMKDGKPSKLSGIMVDVTERMEVENQRKIQKDLLEFIAGGASLKDSLTALALAIESQIDGTVCSIMMMDSRSMQLRHGTAPNLPVSYWNTMDGVPVNASSGSCGTAAFRRELVIVKDVRTDPLWIAHRDIAVRHGLLACWSSPIVDAKGEVLAVFAMYKREPGSPSAKHIQLLEIASQIAIIAIGKDKVDQTVRAKERELRTITDLIPGPVARINLERRYVFMNKYYEKLKGKSRDLLIGRTMTEVLGEDVFAHAEPYKARALNGEAVSFECSLSLDQNESTTYLIHYQPEFAPDRSVQGFIVVGFDITERKQTETALERNRELLEITGELAKIGGWELDLRNSNLYWTEQVYRIHEMDPNIAPTVEQAIQFYAPNGRPALQAALQEAILHGTSWNLELPLVTAKGRNIWVLAQGVSMMENGKAIKLMGAFQDITQRKESEAVRDTLESQLRESQKLEAVGTLAGGIAHDFNNILAIILGNTVLGGKNVKSGILSEVERNLYEIKQAAERARDLVHQIISFSRKQPTKLKTTELAPIIAESVRLLRSTLPARVGINVSISEHVPAVQADATLIEQVIVNLATNSLQAMHGGSGEIEIRVENVKLDDSIRNSPSIEVYCEAHPGQIARIVVRDNGCGMDEKTMNRIYEPFFTTKEVGEGTGLGLSVVHGIVQSHDGVILVDSELGKGTTFSIYLPADRSLTHVSPKPASKSSIDNFGIEKGSPLNILVVDDDVSVLLSVKCLLECHGHRVFEYSNQLEAISAIHSNPSGFDVALIDYNMPGLSGIDLIRQLRLIRQDLPAAVTSGFVDEELLALANSTGILEVIPKPYRVEDLNTVLQRLYLQSINYGSTTGASFSIES